MDHVTRQKHNSTQVYSHDSIFVDLLLPLTTVREGAVLPVGMVTVAAKDQLMVR